MACADDCPLPTSFYEWFDEVKIRLDVRHKSPRSPEQPQDPKILSNSEQLMLDGCWLENTV
ncbi:hypothetical protein CLAFUW4_04096 [Fulvia fulva]|uniref:Uncharacterized protein n=1 Tax=Passalora fulva TaxID=5499 RepID=A0A9Q8P870_PASFU|nr:uncharacterized protein CLAFUR5_04059 [Fulvia fulva]KAK4626698.1 hypothetical protein CLAFUR4_04082 [Fulvia fulva]KAK4628427.1 hypothetical protein CLAFUR0_04083 [Fulvia fulva]UJO16652.1 hypothetical protein CLAFUR5_04059 [Fulvia fulva]WPV13124.1 hypothetical protein CLAFUW4_04096 [Fulvia fulva]WPV28094.1 hypothetical protein CLAFUW7_04085 [Fulvia fulva]